jgi:hypothetical protein
MAFMCFRGSDNSTARFSNLLSTGQQPMGTGDGSVKRAGDRPVTGEWRMDTGSSAGANEEWGAQTQPKLCAIETPETNSADCGRRFPEI